MEGIDGHPRAIGEHANRVETGIVEALKAKGQNVDGTAQFAGWEREPTGTDASQKQ